MKIKKYHSVGTFQKSSKAIHSTKKSLDEDARYADGQ
jgi:hypothetical protein